MGDSPDIFGETEIEMPGHEMPGLDMPGLGLDPPSQPLAAAQPYRVLARKYRPRTFAELIGQSQVTDPLRTALRTNRVNHAYLFSGPRGKI